MLSCDAQKKQKTKKNNSKKKVGWYPRSHRQAQVGKS
jgi:hypothetical protein